VPELPDSIAASCPPAVIRSAPGTSQRIQHAASVYAIFVVLIILVIAGTLASSDFLSVNNFLSIGQAVAFVGFAAIGMTFVTISGNFVDLSVPAAVAGSGIVALAAQPYVGPVGGLLLGVGTGAVIGIVNGIFIGYLRANPVIVTLATVSVGLGVVQLFVGGQYVYNHSDLFAEIAQGDVLGIPNVLIALALAALVAHLLLTQTVFGRWVYATGGGYPASQAAGVPVRRTVAVVFILCGTFAALGGVFLASMIESARQSAGTGYEFDAVAAVAVGGNSLFGGSGTIPRTLVGVFIVGIINNLMILTGIPAEAQGLVKGMIIAIAVFVDVRLRREATR
jgi:ribose/xylose/arabinose/galactoside ABC-type transport system permease subunit